MKLNQAIRQAAVLLFCIAVTGAQNHSRGAESSGAEAQPKDVKLPPAKEIIDKFVKAIGGKEAYAKIESQHVKGKFQMPAQGIVGELEIFAKRPDKMLVKMNIPVIGDTVTGFDGTVGWILNPATGPILADGKQLDELKEQADFDAILHESKDIKSMETLSRADFGGKDCFKVKMVRTSGQETTEFYDSASGLFVGAVASRQSPFGSITVTNSVGDYKKFGDILFATKTSQKMGPIEQVMTFDSMEFNQVPDSAFDRPKEIQALIKK